jgi:DNA-binding NtrC family response regulator
MNVLWISSPDQFPCPGHTHRDLVYLPAVPDDALARLETEPVEAIVVTIPIEGWPAPDFIEELRAAAPPVPIVVRAAEDDLMTAVRLTKAGAFHVIHEDAPENELNAAIRAAVECQPVVRRRPLEPAARELWRQILVGDSPAMNQLVEFIRLAGPRRCTVMITGETGTGKELVARSLHMASPRAGMPLVALNCAALPEHLLEAELFGHVRGAYTGAISNRAGRFEQAHRGTLFLDEIAEMPLDLQAKLLRVLQEREFQRLGSSETVRVDVRVIAACNVDVLERVRTGRFREDLYYRLAVVPIAVAPLRERAADIPLLVNHFTERVAALESLPRKRVSPEALERLVSYDWPGNVRQLENMIESAVILSGDRLVLTAQDFRFPATERRRPVQSAAMPLIPVPDQGLDFESIIGQIELSLLEQALRKTNGNKKQAAEMLRLKRTTLSAKLKSLELLAG